MIKCPVCKELLSPNAPTYKVSRGFVGIDGLFVEDVSVVFHQECSDLIAPYPILEEDLQNS